ncbi:MAG: RusA family crossover junction endodeoxyribonuclease [Clostridia bacterium]|nr:RusA family crossover junction endodeoxyribonuclease [Clostridia bacterium]
MEVRFSVLGEPQGKGRPRFARRGAYVKTYTPEATEMYENLIRLEYRRQCGDYKFEDGSSVGMSVNAYYSVPKSASRKKAERMLAGDLRPNKKPDADNIMKVVADSLNGIAYRDDTQIAECEVNKYYGETPRIEVNIRDIKGE